MKRLLLLVILLLVTCQAAQAQQCAANTTITSPISFTGIDILSGGHVDTTATLTIQCTGLIGLMQVCPSFSAGTGGANGSTSRHLKRVGGTETINVQLFQDAGYSIPWGSLTDPSLGTVPAIGVVLVLGLGGTATQTVYARLFGNQQTAAPGTYTSTIDMSLRFGAVSLLTGCNSPLLTSTQNGPSFQVQATVPKSCLLSVQDHVNFGAVPLLNSNIDTQGSLAVQCTNTTPYNIALSAGNGTGATVTDRKMTGPGGATVNYQIFRDSGMSQNWGQTIGSDTYAATGSGLLTLKPVFGRVPPQTTPAAGTYNDTLLVTLTY
ncbi:spore coat protein U domain-containing protein [Pseudorhodoplanes sp.]|uniref:Csu type fimbrial protein n=1 Tax=Pseudorhodoplanes sp. TaxID=1934341 RepID=UPI002C48501A|nr:spore coat protein U domain-containing protein [Pseudorhodoplanes sp.]HWV53629.1 spore coat protein U domain-containing protein [Pseudorhodoplanes sp.]